MASASGWSGGSVGSRAAARLAVLGDEQRRAHAAQFAGKLAHARRRRIGRHEHQDRIARRNERHRPVQEFRAAERLGVPVARLLELERRFAGDRQRRSAADGDEAPRVGDRRHAALQSSAARAASRSGRRAIASPARARRPRRRQPQPAPRAVAMNVLVAATLSSGPAQIGSTTSQAAASGQSGALTIADRQRAGALALAVSAMRSSLRPDCEMARKSCSFRCIDWPIDAGDVRRRRRDGNADVTLDQMLAERRSVRRAAARAGDDDLRRPLLEALRRARPTAAPSACSWRDTATGASRSSCAICAFSFAIVPPPVSSQIDRSAAQRQRLGFLPCHLQRAAQRIALRRDQMLAASTVRATARCCWRFRPPAPTSQRPAPPSAQRSRRCGRRPHASAGAPPHRRA